MRVNPDTDAIEFESNGARSAYRWLRVLERFLVPALTIMVIPVALYSVRHYTEHDRIETFMQAGPRFHSNDAVPGVQDTAALLIKAQSMIDETIDRRVPPQSVTDRLSALEDRQAIIEAKLDRIIELMLKNQ